jgi:oxepin-CoA hydrolase/3-oxo-5,6-dehydrosuberyl-CoA semialdehyde dehydrogenase
MGRSRFDVNDAELRDSFLRFGIVAALAGLAETSEARWGRMTAQEMVEHLTWAFELSTGQAETECTVPAAEPPRLKGFLYHNRPTQREFMNPALASGLPALRYGSLTEAKAALDRELKRFLEESPARPERFYIHPIFGPIGYEEWHRTHFKHTYHHLHQFGLLEEE